MSIKREQGKDIDRANDIPYSLDVIHRGIRSAEVNIATFEDAIKREREDIGKFRWMIEMLNSGNSEKIKQVPYTNDALEGGIKTAEDHIVTFETSIETEKEQITQFKWMIEVLEKKQERKEEIRIQLEKQKLEEDIAETT